MQLRVALVFLPLALPVLADDSAKIELRGQFEPPVRRTSVFLRGADFPYYAETRTDVSVKFRFKRLVPGSYVVNTLIQGIGEVHRTVTISPALKDAKGRIFATISLRDMSSEELKNATTVSIHELAIPPKARSEYFKAQRKLTKPDIDGATVHLRRAVQLAPGFVDAWNHLGTIAYQSGNYSEAEKNFRRALSLSPSAYPPLVNLGGTLLNLRRFPEAMQYNQRSVARRPEDPLANSQLGINLYFLGNLDAALKYLTKAKQLDPNHFSEPQFFIGQIYVKLGDIASAVREFEDLLARHPETGNTRIIRERIRMLTESSHNSSSPDNSSH